MMKDLMRRVQEAQNMALDTAQLIPEGTYGRQAVLLAFEALRLGWYMMRGDRVGIAEKKYYVQLAYARLMEELDEK